jgi:hypothetical protein
MKLSSRLTAEPRAQLAAPTELRPASVSTARLSSLAEETGRRSQAVRLNRQLVTASSTIRGDLDSFDPFNSFNIDVFNSWRSSPENSATYDPASLVWALPLTAA